MSLLAISWQLVPGCACTDCNNATNCRQWAPLRDSAQHHTDNSQMLFIGLGKINKIMFSSFISLNRFSLSFLNPIQASHFFLFYLYLQLAFSSHLFLTAAVWNAHGMQWILCHSCVLPQGGIVAKKVLSPTPELHYKRLMDLQFQRNTVVNRSSFTKGDMDIPK